MSTTDYEIELNDDNLEIETNSKEIIYDEETRKWSLIMQLSIFTGFIFPFAGIVAPLVIWFTKRDENELVAIQGKEVANLIITQVIVAIISFILSFILIGILGYIALGIHALVVTIVGSIRANEGKFYRYPYIFRFID